MSNHFEIVAVSSPGKLLEEVAVQERVRAAGIEIKRTINPFSDLLSLWTLYRFFLKERPDIVHSHTPKAGLLSMLAARIAGVDIRMHTVAGLPWTISTGFKRKLLEFTERVTYKNATHVYCNSFEQKRFLEESKITGGKTLKVLGNGSSNGIDIDFFNPDKFSVNQIRKQRLELGVTDSTTLFLFIGRLVKAKGIREVIAGFLSIRKEEKNDAKLIVLGKFEGDIDPIEDKYVDLIKNHPDIYFMGYQRDVRPFLAIANCLVFPSYREGFPNVVLQAAAMNVPAIVSNINGCNEIIKDRKNGLILEKIDQIHVAKSMLYLCNNRDVLASITNNSRKIIIEKFNREIIWKELLKEYNNSIDKTRV